MKLGKIYIVKYSYAYTFYFTLNIFFIKLSFTIQAVHTHTHTYKMIYNYLLTLNQVFGKNYFKTKKKELEQIFIFNQIISLTVKYLQTF